MGDLYREDDYLLRPHKEEMLNCMSHAWHVVGITEASNVDIDSSAGFVGVRIVYQKSFKLVG